MIIIKSQREIELMRTAGRIVALTLEEIEKHIKVGITTAELDKIAEEFILSQMLIQHLRVWFSEFYLCIYK